MRIVGDEGVVCGNVPWRWGLRVILSALVRAMAETNHQSTALVHPDGLIARQLQQTAIRLFTATFRNVMDLRVT